jgi:hypothetical protein
MSKLHIPDVYELPEWQKAMTQGWVAQSAYIDNLAVRVVEEGDAFDLYDLHHLRFKCLCYQAKPEETVQVATRLLDLAPEIPDYPIAIADLLYEFYSDHRPALEVALAHIRVGLELPATGEHLGSRFHKTMRLRTLELALQTKLGADDDTIQPIIMEIFLLAGGRRVFRRNLLDALKEHVSRPNCAFPIKQIAYSMRADIQGRKLSLPDENVDVEMQEVEALLAKAKTLSGM